MGALFYWGIVPGVLLAAALMLYVAYVAHKRNYPRSEKVGARAFLKYSLAAFPAILTPVILLVGIYTGVMTPTEAGAVAGLYAMLIAFFAYRMLSWEGLKAVLKDTVRSVARVPDDRRRHLHQLHHRQGADRCETGRTDPGHDQ